MELSRLFEERYWKAFLDPAIWIFLLTGLQLTVTIAAAAIVFSLPIGTLLALGRLNRLPLIHYPATIYIEVVRALPVLLIIFFTFFGAAHGFNLFGLQVSWADPAVATIVALTVYTAAVNAE